MEFGQRLKNLRLSQRKTQQDLASRIGVSVVAVRSTREQEAIDGCAYLAWRCVRYVH